MCGGRIVGTFERAGDRPRPHRRADGGRALMAAIPALAHRARPRRRARSSCSASAASRCCSRTSRRSTASPRSSTARSARTSEFAETLVSATALLFPALGIALAFRAGLFNIGAEGQLVLGGLAAGVAGTSRRRAAGRRASPSRSWPARSPAALWGGIAGVSLQSALRRERSDRDADAQRRRGAARDVCGQRAAALRGRQRRRDAAARRRPRGCRRSCPTRASRSRSSSRSLVALALRFVFDRTVFGFELRAAGEAPGSGAARRHRSEPDRAARA